MREFLKGLFEDDTELIDTIMAEYGKNITNYKEKIDSYKEEVEGYKNQINELNSKIESDNQSLENLQNLTNENKDLKAQIQMKDSNVKKEFSEFVTSKVMSMVNEDNDFSSALEEYKKENPQYFGETVVVKAQTSPTLNGGIKEFSTNDIMNDILRNATNNE